MHIPTNFETIKRVCLGVGLVGLGTSAFMTFKFGWSISFIHAVSLVAVTVAASVIFPARRFLADMGISRTARVFLSVAACGCVALELFADLGYTIGMRDKQMVESSAQSDVYKARHDSMISEQTNVEMWRSQLAELKARQEATRAKNKGWVTSVQPTALEAMADEMDTKITNETARGGCKTKCETLKAQKTTLMNMVADAKAENDLTARIEAAQRVVDKKVDQSATTSKGHSTARAQVDFVSKGYLLLTSGSAEQALSPDVVTMTVADWVIGFAMALGATFLPMVMFYIAFFKADEATAVVNSAQAKVDSMVRQATTAQPAATKQGDTYVRLEQIDGKLTEAIKRAGIAYNRQVAA